MKMKLRLSVAMAAALVVGPAAAYACSVCVSGDSGPMGDAYNWSVLFLMATPYTVMGSLGTWLAYKYRRSAARQKRLDAGQALTRLELDYKEIGK